MNTWEESMSEGLLFILILILSGIVLALFISHAVLSGRVKFLEIKLTIVDAHVEHQYMLLKAYMRLADIPKDPEDHKEESKA